MSRSQKYIILLGTQPIIDNELRACFEQRGFLLDDQSNAAPDLKTPPSCPPAAILVHANKWAEHFTRSIQKIKNQYEGQIIPVLAILSEPKIDMERDLVDSVLLAPTHHQQIVSRTLSLIRLAVMQHEIGLRLQTLQEDFGVSVPLPKTQDKSQFSILFIGKASPEFMVIINALQHKNVKVTAAFTSFTAFDYLYEKTFDAVVMNGLNGTEPAFSITQTMRKNAKLYPVPALLLVKPGAKLNYREVYEKGFNDILVIDAPQKEISARVIEQANFHRLHQNLKAEFSSFGGTLCVDQTSMLFNRAFFNAHIARISKRCQKTALPLSICLIKLRREDGQNAGASLSYAYHQIASMIKNLVRMQDIAARLDSNLFAVAFPGQTVEELKPLAERLSAIIGCVTLNNPQTNKQVKLKLEIKFETLIPAQSRNSSAA